MKWKIATAALLLLVGIGASARFVRSEDADRTAQDDGAARTPTTLPQVSPMSPPTARASQQNEPHQSQETPLQLPTPVSIPAPTSSPPSPTPTPRPQPPDARYWQIDAGRLVSMSSNGVWLTAKDPQYGVFHPAPDGMTVSDCRAATDDEIIVVATNERTGEDQILAFDTAAATWTTRGTMPMAASSESASSWNFCGAHIAAGTLIVLTPATCELQMALSTDGGRSFRTRTMTYPAQWAGLESLIDVDVLNVIQHDDELVISLCTWYSYDVSCPVHILKLDLASLLRAPNETVTWQDLDGQVMTASPGYVGSYSDIFSGAGMDNDAIDIVQIGDEAWRMERYNTLLESYLDFSSEQGSWMAGPIDATPAAFPRGFKPRLYLHGDTAIAAVPLARRPASNPPVRYFTTVEWWIYDLQLGEWTALDLPVHTQLFVQQDTTALDGGLHLGDNGELFFVPSEVPAAPTWHEIRTHRPTIAGDRMYALAPGALLISRDRGASWERSAHPPVAGYDSRLGCGTVSGSDFVYSMRDGLVPRQLIVESETGRRVVELPRRPQPTFVSTSLLPACRPLRLDDAWHLARYDANRNALVVTSISDDDAVREITIDLTGPWADAIPDARSYNGSVDLYQHNDMVVVHICTVNEGAMCTPTDLSFHPSLLGAEGPVSIRAAAQLEADPQRFMPPNNHVSGAAEELFQLGKELWRSDEDEVLGDCLCGEGGDTAPYYSWVGGTFDGTDQEVPTRTIGFALLNGQVIRCGSDAIPRTSLTDHGSDSVDAEPERRCQVRAADDSWQTLFGPTQVDWATVPLGEPVEFIERDEQGRVLVRPLGS